MSKITHIAEASHDNTLWSPRDCLENFISAIDSGEVKPKSLSIVYFEEEGKQIIYGYQNSKLSYTEHIAMLDIVKDMALSRFKGF